MFCFYSKRIPRGLPRGQKRKRMKNGLFFIKLKIESLPLNTSGLCPRDYLLIKTNTDEINSTAHTKIETSTHSKSTIKTYFLISSLT